MTAHKTHTMGKTHNKLTSTGPQHWPLHLLLLLLVVSLGLAGRVEAAARLIRLPLQRATSQGAGQFGQPIISYYTPVGIGTPTKQFNLQFDTSYSGLFVPHYSWNPFNRNLHYGQGFQCKASSSCTKDDRQRASAYQNCQLTGKRYEDQFSLWTSGHSATVVPQNFSSALEQTLVGRGAPVSWRQSFLAISSASDGRFAPLPVDGFVGLSPVAGQSSSGAAEVPTNILVALHQANQLDNLQFSYWYNPILDSSYGGELILGGVEPARYHGQIYWHHLPAAGAAAADDWTLNLQYVSLGGQLVGCASGQQCRARLSSGYSDIYGPANEVKTIYNLLNTSHQSSGLELIDCRRIAQLPVLTFNIDGIPYALLPSNYVRKTLDGVVFKTETCYVAILPSADRDQRLWTLGSNFLGAYYSIFDLTYRQVGFAALR